MKKTPFIFLILFLALSAGFPFACIAQKSELHTFLLPIRENDKWGFADTNGLIVLKPQFDYISDPAVQPFVRVFIGDKQGAVNAQGKFILPVEFDYIGNLNDTLVEVSQNGLRGVFSQTLGHMVCPVQYEQVYLIENTNANRNPEQFIIYQEKKTQPYKGLYSAQGKHLLRAEYLTIQAAFKGTFYLQTVGGWYLATPDGVRIAKDRFQDLKSLFREYYAAKKDNQWAVIKAGSKELCPFMYDSLITCKENYILTLQDKKFGILNHLGKTIIPNEYTKIDTVGSWFVVYKNKSCALVDTFGNFRFPLGKADSFKRAEPYLAIQQNQAWGLYEPTTNKILLEPKYDDIISNHDNLHFYYQKKESVGCLRLRNEKLEVIAQPQYEQLIYLNGNRLFAKQKGRWGIIENDNFIISPRYQQTKVCENNTYYIVDSLKDARGVLDNAGRIILPARYQHILYLAPGYFQVQYSGAFGIFDTLGKPVLMPDYTDIALRNKGFLISRGNKVGWADSSGKILTEPQYSSLDTFNKDFFICAYQDKYGLLNKDGRILVKPVYDAIELLDSATVLLITEGKKTEFSLAISPENDNKRQLIVIPKLEEAPELQVGGPNRPKLKDIQQANQLFWGFDSDKKEYFIGYQTINDGNFSPSNAYKKQAVDNVRFKNQFFHGFVIYSQRGERVEDSNYFILHEKDNDSTHAIKINYYAKVYLYDADSAKVIRAINLRDGGHRLLDPTNGKVSKVPLDYGFNKSTTNFSFIGEFVHGRAPFALKTTTGTKEKIEWGYLDANGNASIPATYEWASNFRNYRAIVAQRQAQELWYGVIDTNGRLVYPLQKDSLAFHPTLDFIQIYKKAPATLLSDLYGNEIAQAENSYKVLSRFQMGLALAQQGKQYGVLDTNFQWVHLPEYDEIRLVAHGGTILRKGKQWGYADIHGSLAQPIQYDEFWRFSSGMVKVKKDGKVGFLNEAGALRVMRRYQEAADFDKNYTTARTGKQWSIVNKQGQETPITIPNLVKIQGFTEGLAAFYVRKGKALAAGFIDTLGNVKIQPTFQAVKPFIHGFALIYEKSKCGAIDKNGKIIAPTNFEQVEIQPNGRLFCHRNGKMGVINADGTVLLAQQYHSARTIQGFTYVQDFDNQKGVLRNDAKGWLIKPSYAEILPLSEGTFTLCQAGKWGVVDTQGKFIIPLQYRKAGQMQNGFCWLSHPINTHKKQNNTYFFDRKGNLRFELPIATQKNTGFINHRLIAKALHNTENTNDFSLYDTCGINLKTKQNLAFQISQLKDCGEQIYKATLKLYTTPKQKQTLLVDAWLNIISQYDLKKLQEFTEGGAALAQSNQYWGMLNRLGFWTILPKYQQIEYLDENRVLCKRTYLLGLLDKNGKSLLSPTYESIQHVAQGNYIRLSTASQLHYLRTDGSWIYPAQ